MTLIASISGIRGTLGGKSGDSLTPPDVVKYACAYGAWLLESNATPKVVMGRDARPSGPMIAGLVRESLRMMGISVVDLGLSTTPTVEMAVVFEQAGGGIILTASHNPGNWNALKLLNAKGEFISAADGQRILSLAEAGGFPFVESKKMGSLKEDTKALSKHIKAILELPEVDVDAITERKFRVMVDAVNSSGGIAVPMLLEALGVAHVEKLYCEPNGQFPHNPEPLPENLTVISSEIQKGKYDLGIVVDPDVDRLVFVNEDGSMFGEEYTLVAVADYVLSFNKGNTVSNLSSTRALQDVTEKAGASYNAAAVGEVNVVEKMKATDAVIGGEGNGGVIYPKLHYGRDALVGIALFLTHLAKKGVSASRLRAGYPNYHISKNKIELTPGTDVDSILLRVREKYAKQPANLEDGVRMEFDKQWVHLRKSNTEPIIRIYSEADSRTTADALASKIIEDIKELLK
ncbi:phosphoglucosamine mutase [Nostoc sp. NIES-2111]